MNFTEYQTRCNELAAKVKASLIDVSIIEIIDKVETPNMLDPAFYEYTMIVMGKMVQLPEYLALAAEADDNKDELIKDAIEHLNALIATDSEMLAGIREALGSPAIYAEMTKLCKAEWYIDPFIQIVWGIENYTATHM